MGIRNRTVVPLPSSLRMSKVPLNAAARSRMPSICDVGSESGAKPCPSSLISSSISRSTIRSLRSTCAAPAWRNTFVCCFRRQTCLPKRQSFPTLRASTPPHTRKPTNCLDMRVQEAAKYKVRKNREQNAPSEDQFQLRNDTAKCSCLCQVTRGDSNEQGKTAVVVHRGW